MPAVNAAEIAIALPDNRPFTLDVLKKIYTQAGEQITDENLKVRAARLKSQGGYHQRRAGLVPLE